MKRHTIAVALLAFAVLFVGLALMPEAALAQTQGNVPGGALGNQSDAEVWQQLRRGMQAQVTIPDGQAGIVIDSRGEDWRSLRNGPLATYGGWVLVGILGVLTLWFAIRGRIRIEGGRSGRTMPRFTVVERSVHWFVAIIFLLLALTGLSILFGRFLVMPLVGKEAWAAYLAVAKPTHDYLGPVFILGLVAMFIVFLAGNGYKLYDLKWALKGGGFFTRSHPPSHRYNFGEKTWFWWVVFVGGAMATSGAVLDFPMLVDGDRETLRLATIVHAIGGVAITGFALGHIYLGTIGMEGALESMTRGRVDENWAKQHHNLWYEDWVKAGRPETPLKRPRRGPAEEPGPAE